MLIRQKVNKVWTRTNQPGGRQSVGMRRQLHSSATPCLFILLSQFLPFFSPPPVSSTHCSSSFPSLHPAVLTSFPHLFTHLYFFPFPLPPFFPYPSLDSSILPSSFHHPYSSSFFFYDTLSILELIHFHLSILPSFLYPHFLSFSLPPAFHPSLGTCSFLPSCYCDEDEGDSPILTRVGGSRTERLSSD